MSKIYYGDKNNTAVELNIGVSQEYVDGQIEAVSADIHSIPTGGTAGQVLSKVDNTDYNTQWIDPPSGSDPDAIKKDGTTVTTAPIPFAEGVEITQPAKITFKSAGEEVALITPLSIGLFITSGPNSANFGRIRVGTDGEAALESVTSETGVNVGFRSYSGKISITDANHSTGTTGQVLTAQEDGTCAWGDMSTIVSGGRYTRIVKTPIGAKIGAKTKYEVFATSIFRPSDGDNVGNIGPTGLTRSIWCTAVGVNTNDEPVSVSVEITTNGDVIIHSTGNSIITGSIIATVIL